GVSILYLCIAQRLDLPLTIITPPGHIFLRHQELNIETTARGIHTPSERYLGINTRSLAERTMKEVVGMAFVNQASLAWHGGDHKIAIDLYEKAMPYMPEDDLLKMLLGINYLIDGRIDQGCILFKKIAGKIDAHSVYADTLPQDYLAGNIDAEGISLAFQMVDEGRESILKKQAVLAEKITRYPKFRAGLLQLATTYMQLSRHGEALEVLQKYHAIDPHDPTVEYYLAALCLERFNFKKAWEHYTFAKATTSARDHNPIALKSLHRQLKITYPE
ncbi:MAG: tetratricopeptide repeat protein, partial [Simkaniaceae bacterium]|nr:tetratricopeptide repeat protein [Simkaniaceae bacterium]